MTYITEVLEAQWTEPAVELVNGELDLARWELDPGRPPTGEELLALERLRGLLRGLVDVVAAGRTLGERELAALNEALATAPSVARLEPAGEGRYVVEMTPVADEWLDHAVAALAGSFASLLRRAPDRVKVCADDGCRRVFVDHSRNRARRWCDGGRCGNRARVRRFRARRG